MSQLEELIQTLCPDGVEYVKLGDIAPPKRGVRVIRSQLELKGDYPVYQNSMTPLGFYEQSNCPANTPFVISAGAAGEVGYSTVEFWAADDCFYFICPENLQYRFLFYALMCQREFLLSRVRRASVPRLARSVIEGLKVPLPPLPVQAEIVRILDTFSSAVTELEAEHAARVRQYENYRNELLSFDSKSKIMEKLLAYHCLNGVDYLKLKEVARISAGGDLPENYIKGQKVPTKQYPFPIYSNGTDENALYGFTDNYKIEKEAVTISARGTIGYHQVRAGKFTPIVRLITMIADESKITTRFLNYVLYIAGIEGVNTGIPSLTVPMLEKINIPLPPLPVQEEIVSILDRFETLVNDLRSGLPAEIALRRKQYEYYRDRLLTFKPLNDV